MNSNIRTKFDPFNLSITVTVGRFQRWTTVNFRFIPFLSDVSRNMRTKARQKSSDTFWQNLVCTTHAHSECDIPTLQQEYTRTKESTHFVSAQCFWVCCICHWPSVLFPWARTSSTMTRVHDVSTESTCWIVVRDCYRTRNIHCSNLCQVLVVNSKSSCENLHHRRQSSRGHPTPIAVYLVQGRISDWDALAFQKDARGRGHLQKIVCAGAWVFSGPQSTIPAIGSEITVFGSISNLFAVAATLLRVVFLLVASLCFECKRSIFKKYRDMFVKAGQEGAILAQSVASGFLLVFVSPPMNGRFVYHQISIPPSRLFKTL